MAINKDQVKYVAKLARIDLDEANLDKFTKQMDQILQFMETLKELDTTDTAPSNHALSIKNVFRKDENKPSLANDNVLQNAPAKENEHFKVPKII